MPVKRTQQIKQQLHLHPSCGHGFINSQQLSMWTLDPNCLDLDVGSV